ncbi:glycosyltransferase family 4 protein [Acidisphaera sp. L21]|uniref:glycosyltransferase family 4 protein n=1 Tax=Acidisphaera sp. L21 TaxID=1641851 RepID=UPI00131A83F6|nr:MraY family glycosyltransferase [Acidisphaera sp. L21]
MTAAAFATHLAFCACLALLSAAAVWGMTHVGTLDTPGARSSHTRPTPKGGGVGIVLAFLVGTLLLYRYAAFSRIADPYFRAVILAALGIAVVAYLDDVLYWPASVKLLAQVAAALLAVGAGLSLPFIRLPWVGTVELGWLGPVLTLCWIVAATNAMNFVDGLNGLASGVSALTCAILAAIAIWVGASFVYFAAMILLAGIAGFLPFNFPRARIFMGDVGSQFCGFLLAVLAVAAGRFEAVELSVALVPMLLAGVLFDVAFTLLRRFMAGQRLAEAHRGHLYQLAHRSGMTAVRVTLVHWGFVLWGGVCCALFLGAAPVWKPLWVVMVLPPQLLWLLFVDRIATRAGSERPVLHWRRGRP